MKKTPVLLALVLIGTSAFGAAVTVSDAWMREPNPARPVGAAFMTLANGGTAEAALVAAESAAAKRVELHEMTMKEGMMSMNKVDRIVIPPKGSVRLAPGGYHLMLFDLTRPLHGGDSVEFLLRFEDGSTARVTAPVRAPEGTK